MRKILFVDDEPLVLAGLQNRLRTRRKQWEMTFVSSGSAALAALDESPRDVVVSDMRMPAMDGATLLEHVRARHPHTVRIILSGQTELEAAMRAVPVAHQFLIKPCDPASLENAVNRACDLHAFVADPNMRQMLGRVDVLPAAPLLYTKLVALLSNQDATAADVGRLVAQDVAMSAKILQIVSSAYFGLARKVDRIEDAVVYLGFQTVKNLALSVSVFHQASGKPLPAGFSIDELQRHSLLTGTMARRMMGADIRREEAFTAGVVHDIGRLLFATQMRDAYTAVLARASQEPTPLHEIEAEVLGLDHGRAGGCLLGLWGLPYGIVEAVLHHHAPAAVEQRGFDTLAALFTANRLLEEHRAPSKACAGDGELRAYLVALGVGDQLDGWRQLVKTMAEGTA